MDNTNTNLWDSIQVDMSAEFDKVKLSLGELKSIEEGLIVDLCSVYDNKISLKVIFLIKIFNSFIKNSPSIKVYVRY